MHDRHENVLGIIFAENLAEHVGVFLELPFTPCQHLIFSDDHARWNQEKRLNQAPLCG
jgi:hypothetical protein